MLKRVVEISRELEEIRDREAVKLWRLARKAMLHGCSERLCIQIRNEGWAVKRLNAEDLLNPFIMWRFAFK